MTTIQEPPCVSRRTLDALLDPADNSFGVLRLAMALIVLVSHSLWFTTGQRDADPMAAVTGFTSGEHAVQVFFLLSGLLVTRSMERSGSVADFALARVLRVFPGLIVCVLITALVIGPIASTMSLADYALDPQLAIYILKTTALVTASAPLPGVFQENPLPGLVNGSLWTLKFEVVCYAGLAAIGGFGLLARCRHGMASGLLVAIIAIASLVLPADTTRYTSVQNLAYFAIPFSIGALACLHRGTIIVSALLPAALALPAWLAIGTPAQNVTTCLFLGSLAFWLSMFKFGVLRAYTNRTDLSYGVYIYAAPIQQSALYLVPGLSATGLTLVTVAPVLLLAALSWHLVEKPAMGLRRCLSARTRHGLGITPAAR